MRRSVPLAEALCAPRVLPTTRESDQGGAAEACYERDGAAAQIGGWAQASPFGQQNPQARSIVQK